jgi:clathrin heavy chain
LFVYEIESATCILQTRISQDTIFTTTLDTNSNGIFGINAKVGQVLSVKIDEKKIVSYLSDNFDKKLALTIAARGELEGAEELYSQSFNELLNKGDIEGAIKVAAESPSGILRSPNTIAKLQKAGKVGSSQKPALSFYFNYILGIDKLNKIESVELSKIVLQKPGGIDYIKQLVSENKMEFSEALGDIVRQYDSDLAIKIFYDSKSHSKIVESLLSNGEFQKALTYCDKVGYDADYLDMFKKLVQSSLDESVKFAISKYKKGLDPNTIIDIYTQQSKIKQATQYLLGILQGDKEEDGALQTKLFEINLLYSPVQVAESIFKQQMYNHYDRNQVAFLCEKAKLYTRALENFSSMDDLKRIMNNAQFIDTDWLVNFFQTVEESDQFELLSYLLKVNLKAHINIVVSVACNSNVAPEKIIGLFEQYKSYEGIYAYLNGSIDSNKDADIVFKYIEAATKIGQFQELERVTRKNEHYDPNRTKEFLKEARLKDMAPLINVCDQHDFVPELIQYLFTEQKLKYIEAFIKQRPLKTPQVIGTLLDCDASEDFIKNLLQGVGNMCPTDSLVQEVEKRNRLKILLQWLESRVDDGSQEPAAHNALAKIYIVNNNADKFLQNNQYYDSRVVGKFCEKKYPNLALIAYIRGECDIEIIDLTNTNGLFKQQAKYLVKKKDLGLWEHALDKENSYRRQLIDYVVQTALPESNVTEEVSITVKAFMKAELPNELIELLEKIILNGSNPEFKNNKNLQNLLILTAIKADPKRVMDYIFKLDNYDSLDIAKIALSSDLFDVAFEIYNKFNHFAMALRVLIEKLKDIERSQSYADKIKQNDCYSILGNAQLSYGLVTDAINSFMLADDPSSYHNVISVAEENGNYEQLIKFLRMAKKKIQDSHIDTELLYSFAKLAEQTDDFKPLAEMEEFLKGSTMAKIQVVGDKCYNEKLFEAARILYFSINNYSSLASTYVQLKRNKDAVYAATKANTPKIWKEVLFSCVEAQDFVYAQQCGIALIKDSDELDEVSHHYEKHGYFNELIELVEKGISNDNNNSSLNTTLSELYAKFKQEKLMSQISRCWKFSNPMRLVNACRDNACWAELVFLHQSYEEHDEAIKMMMEHSSEAFNLSIYNDNIIHVSNVELYYKSIDFFLNEQPELLLSLLLHIKDKINHEKVTQQVSTKNLPLIKKYLEYVQEANLAKVNETLNFLYIEEEDFDSLRNSVSKYNNFDQTSLAKKLEFHDLLEFRRIATLLFKLNQKWNESIDLSLKDKLYKDAMQTASESGSSEVAEKLLNYFVKNQLNECFAACLYTCYDLIKPDVALELSWRNNIQDMAMPYLIQVLREFTLKVGELEKAKEDSEKKIEKISQIQNDTFEGPNSFENEVFPINNNNNNQQGFEDNGWF